MASGGPQRPIFVYLVDCLDNSPGQQTKWGGYTDVHAKISEPYFAGRASDGSWINWLFEERDGNCHLLMGTLTAQLSETAPMWAEWIDHTRWSSITIPVGHSWSQRGVRGWQTTKAIGTGWITVQ